jgi:hypothetical protein
MAASRLKVGPLARRSMMHVTVNIARLDPVALMGIRPAIRPECLRQLEANSGELDANRPPVQARWGRSGQRTGSEGDWRGKSDLRMDGCADGRLWRRSDGRSLTRSRTGGGADRTS